MLAKKDILTIQREAAAEGESGLKRVLGPLQLIAIGIGCIIGAGIFVMTGEAAQVAGPALMLSFVLGAIACGFAGLCYAELASIIPVSGSAYTYSYATLGEVIAWIVGWCLVLEYGVASSTVAVGWSGYFVSLLKDLGIVIPAIYTQPYGEIVTLADGTTAKALVNLPAFLSMMVVTGILMLGVKESAMLNNIMVVIKSTVIIAFIAVGVFYINPDLWTPFIPLKADPVTGAMLPHYGGIVSGAGLIFFAYIGFDAVSTAAQESKNPQRDMPIGILGSLIICTILYIAVAAVMTGVVDYRSLAVPDPIAVAVDAMKTSNPDAGYLNQLVYLVKIGAVTGLFSVMLVCTYSQIRINYVMSSDGLLPPAFKRLSEKRRTPVFNTLCCGLLIGLIAAFMPLSALGTLVSMGTLLAFTIVCVGVVYLRRAQPELARPFRCPGIDTKIPFTNVRLPWVPIGGALSCLYLMFGFPSTNGGWHMEGGLPWKTLEHFAVWLSAGMAIYFLYGYTRSKMFTPARDFAARKVLGVACVLIVVAVYPLYLKYVEPILVKARVESVAAEIAEREAAQPAAPQETPTEQ